MSRDQVEAKVRELLVDLAPEFEASEIDPDEDLREQLDIDSMDLHQLAGTLYETYGVDIPEADRAGLTTVNTITDYVALRVR
jgi:acyl carrier protein